MILDPVELELLYHKVKAVTEEMGITLARTARSSYVRETHDFGTALVGAQGKFFAFPADIGVSLSLDMDCRKFLEMVPDLDPGDVIVTNHPYHAAGVGSHLPDVNLLKPYFHRDRLVCYGWSFVHFADIGGGVAGSISPSFDNIFQEGFQIPPMKMMARGKFDDAFLRLFRANSRVPWVNDGDMQAQLAALAVGERRVAEVIAQHGVDAFLAAQTELPRYAQRRALAVQRRIPDGEWVFWDYLDDDFRSRIPVRLRCRMTVRDGQITLDLDGTDPQLRAAYNVPTGGVRNPYFSAKMMHFLLTHDSEIPLNHGLLDNITVNCAQGTVMNPEFPAPVGIRHATAIRFGDALQGCLAQANPGTVPAAAGGTVIPVVVSQIDFESGRRKVVVLQSLVGGAGAGPMQDGADGRDRSLANVMNTPTEQSEADLGIRIERYALRPDSGGAGKFRGGMGVVYSIRILREGTELLGRGLERFVFQPWGIAGGRPGAPAKVVLNLGTEAEQDLGKIDVVRPRIGDVLTIMTPGGGGYGDAFERDPVAVEADVRLGLVSIEAALSDYGIAFDKTLRVDHAATAARRAAKREKEDGIVFDSVRRTWEEVFDDVAMTRLAKALLGVPAAIRSDLRTRIFEAVLPGVSAAGPRLLSDPNFDRVAARGILASEIDGLQRKWPVK